MKPLKWLAVVCCLAALPFLMASFRASPTEELRVKRIVIVDDSGSPRIELGTRGNAAYVKLLNEGSGDRSYVLLANQHGNSGFCALYDHDEGGRCVAMPGFLGGEIKVLFPRPVLE